MDLQKAIKDTKNEYKNIERKNEENEVIEKYGNMFNPNNLDSLSKEDFKSFLLIKNNKHWEGIHRQGNMITQDMNKLKNALKILLDEEKSIKERLNYLFPKNKPSYIKGLGRAIVTPILMVVYPEKYGVYNRRSDEGLKKVDLMPKFDRGDTFSKKYIEINKVLNSLALENNMTLFELDSVWWRVTEGYKPITDIEEEAEETETNFALEIYLRRFLVDNWEKTQLGKKYEIISEDGEIIGEEYQTKEVGNIDILAKDKKNENEWIVIELKKGQSNDAVIGQTLRYMGWVEKNLIKDGNGSVKGIIIVNEIDQKLKYALASLKSKININCLVYNVKFSLNEMTQF